MQLILGVLRATPRALDAFGKANARPLEYITRHMNGDWGVVDEEDKQSNDDAVRLGNRVLSAYLLPHTEEKIWIITEADRSATTILLPKEY